MKLITSMSKSKCTMSNPFFKVQESTCTLFFYFGYRKLVINGLFHLNVMLLCIIFLLKIDFNLTVINSKEWQNSIHSRCFVSLCVAIVQTVNINKQTIKETW